MAVPLRADFDAVGVRCWARKSNATDHRRGGFWRWRRFMREPVGRRRPGLAWVRLPDRSRLGAQVQRRWSGGSDRPEGSGTATASQRRAPSHPCRDHRERPDPGCSWDRAVADRRSLPMDLRGIPRRHLPADPEPGIARHGLSQAFGSSAASRAGCRRD